MHSAAEHHKGKMGEPNVSCANQFFSVGDQDAWPNWMSILFLLFSMYCVYSLLKDCYHTRAELLHGMNYT